MEYIKLYLEHELDNEPIIILYEINLENDRLALRSIDIFANRKTRNIDNLYEEAIEIVSIPTIEEFHDQTWGERLYTMLISKEEFETIWNEHFYSRSCNPYL